MSREKSITLMGMSGVGKTHFSLQLKDWGWGHHSCDVEIGKDLLDIEHEMQADDIDELMHYLGFLGDTEQGGKDFDDYIKHQKFYKIAEMHSLLQLKKRIRRTETDYFVNDSTGSFCEITDPDVIDFVADQTLIVYIKASGEEEQTLLERAEKKPKPIYYPPAQFPEWIATYLKDNNLTSTNQMAPKDFARWVFPLLLDSRKPKYQTIADKHGITITSADLHACTNEQDFKNLIGLTYPQGTRPRPRGKSRESLRGV